jgi:serine/threonine protein kinase
MICGKKYDGKLNFKGLKSDLWSCGIVFFTILSGYLPFDD